MSTTGGINLIVINYRNLEGLGRLQYLLLAATVALDRSVPRPQNDLYNFGVPARVIMVKPDPIMVTSDPLRSMQFQCLQCYML